ncbi:hypothetical protein PR048_022498 [Dryococelus australis]|uniref:Uncharacterized protein n=1 Tax=Dryococelus australis TaxID=614101 RepID=A0ABQ9H190_9NEOP|nr:hypothetical protein PR048_022498 [Dryococelus australis]
MQLYTRPFLGKAPGLDLFLKCIVNQYTPSVRSMTSRQRELQERTTDRPWFYLIPMVLVIWLEIDCSTSNGERLSVEHRHPHTRQNTEAVTQGKTSHQLQVGCDPEVAVDTLTSRHVRPAFKSVVIDGTKTQNGYVNRSEVVQRFLSCVPTGSVTLWKRPLCLSDPSKLDIHTQAGLFCQLPLRQPQHSRLFDMAKRNEVTMVQSPEMRDLYSQELRGLVTAWQPGVVPRQAEKGRGEDCRAGQSRDCLESLWAVPAASAAAPAIGFIRRDVDLRPTLLTGTGEPRGASDLSTQSFSPVYLATEYFSVATQTQGSFREPRTANQRKGTSTSREPSRDFAWAAVAERLHCSPPTKENQVRSPAGSLPDFAIGNRAGRWRWFADFLGDLPFLPPLHSGAAPLSPNFTLNGSQDLVVKSSPDLLTLINSVAEFTHRWRDLKKEMRYRIPEITVTVIIKLLTVTIDKLADTTEQGLRTILFAVSESFDTSSVYKKVLYLSTFAHYGLENSSLAQQYSAIPVPAFFWNMSWRSSRSMLVLAKCVKTATFKLDLRLRDEGAVRWSKLWRQYDETWMSSPQVTNSRRTALANVAKDDELTLYCKETS